MPAAPDRLSREWPQLRERQRTSSRQGQTKRTQHLAELEALYRAADAGLALLDRDLRYVRLNERLAAMNGRR